MSVFFMLTYPIYFLHLSIFRDDSETIDMLRRENAELIRKNEEMERELEWRKAQEMQRYQFEQMQHQMREMSVSTYHRY